MVGRLDDGFARGMVVVAHADDAEWGCSGTVARWCAEGWDVVYVLCTDGSKGSDRPEITSEELVEIRRLEQEEAGRVLGLSDVVFLGYPDGYLEPTLALRKDITRQIRRHRPDVLICMNPGPQSIGATDTSATRITSHRERRQCRPCIRPPGII